MTLIRLNTNYNKMQNIFAYIDYLYLLSIMKLDIKKLIEDSGENLTQSALAQEMVDAGIFKTKRSAVNMIQYHNKGNSKSVDWSLLKFLCSRFHVKGSEVIVWDN